MHKVFLSLIVAGILLRATYGQAETLPICEGLAFVYDDEAEKDRVASLSFSDSEKQYLCGSATNESWKVIPWNQRQAFANSFLESRGFHSATFKWQKPTLLIRLGRILSLKKIYVVGGPPEFDISRARGFVDSTLTPSLLNNIEAWAIEWLKHAGYPCSKLATTANNKTGDVVLTIRDGSKRVFGDVAVNPIDYAVFSVKGKSKHEELTLAPEVAGRYQAFSFNDNFGGKLLELSQRRPIAAGLLLNTFYSYDCGEPDSTAPLKLKQSSALSTPRTVTFGVGVNTEGIVVAKAGYRHNLLDSYGSQFESKLEISRRTQEVDTYFRWFPRPASRLHIKPRLYLSHADERHYEEVAAKIQIGPVMSIDQWGGLISVETGPAWEQTRSFRGPGAGETKSLLFEGFAGYQSHDFEYFRGSPRQGVNTGFSIVAANENIQSTYTATKATWTGQLLKNLGSFDPPLAVFGVRWRLAQTIATDKALADLPNRMLHYLGGSSDLRGFDRQELPLSGTPKRSTAYLGMELRHSLETYPSLQPFTFLDAGKFGTKKSSFDKPIYWAPGVGLRWETMFGVIRGTAAHGFIKSAENFDPKEISRHSHWQLYFSFGEEF